LSRRTSWLRIDDDRPVSRLISGATRLAGSSIVAPSATNWVSAFLLAAFYRRPRAERSVDDLRLAHGVLATFWARQGRRLSARDRTEFRSAFEDGGLSRVRGRLDQAALRAGGAKLLGDWFPEAWDDVERRAYGIAFPTRAERDHFDPGARLKHARLGPLAPPGAPAERQIWATYPPVELRNPKQALALLSQPERWPDFSCAGGRFTPVRAGGLLGQTFEIHLAAHPTPHLLLATRGYVTCTAVHFCGEPLETAIERIPGHLAAVPSDAERIGYVELTTHRGHFMGRGISRLLIYATAGRTLVRDVGSWDPLPPLLAVGYKAGGHDAQVAFWGPDDPEVGMLAQLALLTM
jgi:hypothetical protein